MLTLPSTDVELLAGTRTPDVTVRPPFDPLVCDFLANLARRLREDATCRSLADVQAFAFWCRPANLTALARQYEDGALRLGRGLLFHIAPSNVPMNAAFSLAFGLLAGNTNLVRVSSKISPQIVGFCSVLRALLLDVRYEALRGAISMIRYPRESNFTAYASALCQGRIIWGGDASIQAIRHLPLPPRAIEVTFADRYSLCVIRADAIAALEEEALRRLAERFYNDTYVMDQNACSSPQTVLWVGQETGAARTRFWRALAAIVRERYDLAAIQAVDKYSQALGDVITERTDAIDFHDAGLYVLPLNAETTVDANFRGRFGLFYEKEASGLDDLLGFVDPIYQTVTQFGFETGDVRDLLLRWRPLGIDRVVPIGRALDIGLTWDGYDLIRTLSRVVDIG